MDEETTQLNQESSELTNLSGSDNDDLNSQNNDKSSKRENELASDNGDTVVTDRDVPHSEDVSVSKHSKVNSNDVNQNKPISNKEQKRLLKLEKKESKKKQKQEKKQVKINEKKENSLKKENTNTTLNVSRLSWGIHKRGQITHQQTDEGDWEDKMLLDLEKKWKELESNQGTMMLSSLRQSAQMIWEKRVKELSLHMDIPELIEGAEIVDENTGTMVYLSFLFFKKIHYSKFLYSSIARMVHLVKLQE